jgi:hypothetical protein
MTQAEPGGPSDEGGPPEAAPAPEPERQPVPPRRVSPAAIWPAILLALVVAGVALSPFWAPAVVSLLPWGNRQEAAQIAALHDRLAALEERPSVRPADLDALKAAESALSDRVGRIEGEAGSATRAAAAAAAAQAATDRLGHRLDAAEAQGSHTAASIAPIQQDLTHLAAGSADLAARIGKLEHQLQAENGVDRSGAALLAILLQIREAVDSGRPFAAEYDALAALARDDPKLAAAAAPLAAAARNGVTARGVLRQRLADLGGQIAGAAATPPAGDWRGKALAELRSLVNVRRIDGAGQSPSEKAVNEAERALSRGDLSAAIAALNPLTGAAAETAAPWLAMAHARLTVEDALRELQKLLVARLDAAGRPPAGPPPKAPS